MIFLLAAAALCGCGRPAAKTTAETPSPTVSEGAFCADSAYAYVARQVAFGPRVPQSAAHDACGRWLAAELRRHGADTVIEQRASLPVYGPMVNIIGRFNLAAPTRVLLLAHWDTRPWADEDPDPANRATPLDGANDGASGTGVLLELARQFGAKAPGVGVDILLVDAEDSGSEGDDASWARGAQYFAANMPDGPLPAYAVLLDMVGGRDARFPREMFSDANARPLTARLWRLAAEMGLGDRFPDRTGGAVNDDHLPLLRAGIPAVDIIETDHPHTGSFNPTWHTLNDNLDNIDPATLGAVGRLVSTLIYNEKL